MNGQVKYLLQESELPRQWYNVLADLPSPPPDTIGPAAYDTPNFKVWQIY